MPWRLLYENKIIINKQKPMKENIFDVLMYLFENYMEDEIEMLPDSDVIRTELLEAGFESCEVNK